MRDFTNAARKMMRRGHGQSSVELILVLPVLLMVAAAICQVALGLNCYLVIGTASREGARRGSETNDALAATTSARSACSGLSGKAPAVSVDFPEGRSRGMPVKVTVAYKLPLLIPGLEKLIPAPEFKRSTSMALEKAR